MMRNPLVLLAGAILLCLATGLFSKAIWGEPIGIDSLRPTPIQAKAIVQEEVRAKRFVLVNEEGTTLGTFGALDGQPAIAMHDQNKKLRALFAIDSNGQPGLVLFGENGNAQAQLVMGRVEPRLVLQDQEKKARAVFALDKDGQPGLGFVDENGKHRAQFDIEGNKPRLVLFDENGKTAFQTPQ